MHDLIVNSSDISNLSDRLSSDSTVQSAMQESPSKNIINLSNNGAAFNMTTENHDTGLANELNKKGKVKRAKTISKGKAKLKK